MTSDKDRVRDFLEDVEADIERYQDLKRWADTVWEGLRDYASHLSYVPERRRKR